MNISRPTSTPLLGLALLLTTLTTSAVAGTPATTADDVCASNANPCLVTNVFDVTGDARLDFGTRAISVSGNGQFNFSDGNGQILCGQFDATTSNAAIDANGPLGGGNILVAARRRCSDGASPPPCAGTSECQLGTCGVRRCTLRTSKVCLDDTDCNIGTCGTNKRCSNSLSFVRCATNADCYYGTCPAQLTCSLPAANPVNCSINSDCDYGSCTVGTASLNLNGGIAGSSDDPASITLKAADNVTITKLIDISSSSLESDGGYLGVEAAFGSVAMTGKVNARGGGNSQGGSVELYAGLDVTVGEEISVVGGDFDGGTVDLLAGRDVTINKSLLANSSSGAGFGGEILVEAARNLVVNGSSPIDKTTIETNGHTDLENVAGDGGFQDYTTGSNLTMNGNTRFLGIGSQPDGTGGDLTLFVSGNLSLNGDITFKTQGGNGAGGFLEASADGDLSVGSTGSLDVTGAGGGIIEFFASGNADFAGSADLSGATTPGGLGGEMRLESESNTVVSGTLFLKADTSGDLVVKACRVTLSGTGELDNRASDGLNRIYARESMKLLSGSLMATGDQGTNALIYRTAAKPPQTSGTITPAPTTMVDPSLAGCPVCGNSEVDEGETCDDGNAIGGDGCSSDCQNENCIAQTADPGYPSVSLCDDGSVCTTDVCNPFLAGGSCQHTAKSCDDQIACTTDSCHPESGVCEHAPIDGACNDGNPCTDDFCSPQLGCSAVANNNACNDGDSCTENDTCLDSNCQGSKIPGCAVCGDAVTTPPEECDDGNTTFTSGESCGDNCTRIPCGKPTNSSGVLPKSSDALFALRSAVGQTTCAVQVCDVDSSGKVLASDAQRILKAAVGQPVSLVCPSA